MTTSAFDIAQARIASISVSDAEFTASLCGGASVSVPLARYPRLLYATPAERRDWRLLDGGRGIRWDALDEDISVVGLLAGRHSGESQQSLARWLAARGQQGLHRA